jgi:hypothetical protein
MKPSKFKNDYLIFFDFVRVDHLVSNFSTSHSVNGGMPQANIKISMQFDKTLTESEYNLRFSQFRDDIYKLKSALKEKTNVFIFVKNIVSHGKYNAIFNGNISSISIQTNRSRRFISLDVRAVGGISMLNQIESVMSIPIEDKYLSSISPEAFKLISRTLDIEEIVMKTNTEANLDYLNIQGIVNKSKEILESTNKIYRNASSVSNFNSIADRINVYSDIEESLLTDDILDWGFATDSLIVETLYVTLAKRLNQIMLEFYEMPDGEIVIKAPYWNTPVLYNHIILDTMIINEDLQNKWDNRVTRTLVRGDIAYGSGGISSDFEYKLKVPMATYAESFEGNGYWADLAGSGINEETSDDLWKDDSGKNMFKDDETGIPHYDNMTLIETEGDDCLAYKTNPLADIYYHGWTAIVRRTGEIKHIDTPNSFPRSARDSVLIQFQSGPYKGFFALYGGLDSIAVSPGKIIMKGDRLGRTYNWYSRSDLYSPDASNFYIRVFFADYEAIVTQSPSSKSNIYVHPKVVLRDYSSGKKTPTTSGIMNVNIEDFGVPTDIEMTYGMSMREESQPLIKYNAYKEGGSTKETMKTLKQYAAYRFKSINANVNTLSLTTLPMPWIKPGFNVWVDPTGLNEIYYVSSVSHSGGPNGIYTNLHLTMGRPADKFFEGDNTPIFGSVRDGGTYGSSIFITKDLKSAEESFNDLGMVKSHSMSSGYKDIMNKAVAYKTKPIENYSMEDDPFLRELYLPEYNVDTELKMNPLRVSDLTLKKDIDKTTIETMLKNLFKNSRSEFAKARSKELSGFISSLKQTWSKNM